MPIMTGHNQDPSSTIAEIDVQHVRKQIAKEIFASDDVVGTYPMHDAVVAAEGWDISKPTEIVLGPAFRRAKTVLQAITYGHDYWMLEYGLGGEADEAAFEGQHGGIIAGTSRLLQLVALARVEVAKVDEHWSLPTVEGIEAVKSEMRKELGVADTYEERMAEDVFSPQFPGLNYEDVIQAILSGKLQLGNPEQPEPICWQR